MKKVVRVGGLLLFWGSTFALVAAAIHYKNKMDLLESSEEVAEEGEESSAEDGEGGDGADGESTDATDTEPTGELAGETGAHDAVDAETRERSSQLFERPASLDPAEFNELVEELRLTKADYQRRMAVVEQRELEVERREEELNHRENEILSRVREIADRRAPEGGGAPAPAVEQNAPPLDPNGVQELALFYQEMKDPSKVKDALLAMDPAQAAAILKAMDKRAGVAVLTTFPLEAFQKVSAIILAGENGEN